MRQPICSFAVSGGEIRLGVKGPKAGALAKLAERRLRGENVRFGAPDLSWATPFQKRVYRALLKIGWGKTITYGALAKRVGSSARAVGGAMRANRLPLVVP